MVFFYAPYRVDNSVQYNTPTVGGFTGRFMYSFGKEDTTKNGRFVSAGVDYRSGPLFIGLGAKPMTFTAAAPTRPRGDRYGVRTRTT